MRAAMLRAMSIMLSLITFYTSMLCLILIYAFFSADMLLKRRLPQVTRCVVSILKRREEGVIIATMPPALLHVAPSLLLHAGDAAVFDAARLQLPLRCALRREACFTTRRL